MNYKIYSIGNYLRIQNVESGEIYNGLLKEVFVDKNNLNNNLYKIQNVKDWSERTALNLNQIKKEDGSDYTLSEWETFYSENTGNFNSGGSSSLPTDVVFKQESNGAIHRADITDSTGGLNSTNLTVLEGRASGDYSHADSSGIASGEGSHADSGGTALGDYSSASGNGTIANSFSEKAIGIYNEDITANSTTSFDAKDLIFSIGIGSDDSNRLTSFFAFKNGGFKFISRLLTNITNATKGFFALDENARPNVHDGTQWQPIAYLSDISGSGGISDAPNDANAYVRSGLAWVVGYTKTAVDTLLATFKTDNFLDASSSIQTQLNAKVDKTTWTDYSATSVIVGFSAFTIKQIWYKIVGDTMFVYFRFQGTSNSADLTFTTPSNNAFTDNVFQAVGYTINNTVNTAIGSMLLIASTNVVILKPAKYDTSWTSSGTKGACGMLTFKI